jgi:putative sterol carrier protein
VCVCVCVCVCVVCVTLWPCWRLQFNVGEGVWTVEFKSGVMKLSNTAAEKPDVVLTASAEDFIALASGTLAPQQAFMQGKVKAKGNLATALKLNTLVSSLKAKL